MGSWHFATYLVNAAHNATTLYFHYNDWLGTERARADVSGNFCETIASLPFGDGQTVAGSCGDVSPMHFTGKERDSLANGTNLDNFGARYDSSAMGRFMSADVGTPHLENPQSFNRYAYALNNPLFYADPDGADSISAVYHLGSASATFWVQQRQSLDVASLLVSPRSTEYLQYNRSVGIGQQPYVQLDPDSGGGGCLFRCVYGYDASSSGIQLQLSFSYNDKGDITSANISRETDTNMTFLNSGPRAEVTSIPGGLGFPPTLSVSIDQSVLKKLSSEQLKTLDAATASSKDFVSQGILKAVLAEQRRREEEQRKADEERRRKCQLSGNKTCP